MADDADERPWWEQELEFAQADEPAAEPPPGTPKEGAAGYAAGDLSANEELLNSAIYHGLSLERVNAQTAQEIKDVLVKAQEEITGKLQSGKLTSWQTQRAQQFLDWSNKVIANAYNVINGNVSDTLDGVKKAEILKQTNSVNQAVGVEISPAMSTQQIEAIAKADELLVNGAVMSDWWKKQAANLQHQVLTTVQQGLAQGQSTQDIADQLRDFLPTDDDISQKQAVAQANALARTAAATVQSEAQQAYYKNNADIMKGIQWVSTLDSRTTPMCQALDGKTWTYDAKGAMTPVGHDQDFPGFPPIHWNCRSTTVPVLKSWQELSKKQLPHLDDQTVQEAFKAKLADQGFTDEQIAGIEMDQRASVDGTVPASTTYEDWLGQQPESVQQSILGPAKWQLWNSGQVSLADMINKATLEPLTVDELVAAAKNNVAIPPLPPPVEGKYGLSLAENQILTAQLTAGSTSGQEWSSWYNPENGTRVDQALANSLNASEAAQLQAQKNLIQLSNTLSNTSFWTKSDANMWAGQDGFQSAKLVTPSGRLITVKLKPGMTWTQNDVSKYWAALSEARAAGLDEFDAQMRAFRATKKMTLTQTEPGALHMDSSMMKKVYGPVPEEQKPLSFLEAHANQQALQSDADLKAHMAKIKTQMQAAQDAGQTYAEQANLAQQLQAELQTKLAQKDLDVAEKAKKEADDILAIHLSQQAQIQDEVDAANAKEAQAAKDAATAKARLEAYEADVKFAKGVEAKIAAEKAAADAAEAAQALADAAAAAQAEAEAKQAAQRKAAADYYAAQAAADAAAKIFSQHVDDVIAKKAQEKALKSAAAKKGAATKAAKKAAAAALNTQGQMQMALEPKAEIKTNFPADPMSLKVVKELGGYTHAQLVEDADGNLWVRKMGASADHIASEVLFDHLYNIAGVDVPESKLYSTPQGNVKLAVFVPDTKILGDYLAQASPAEKARILGVVQNQFVANALFANWDAVGANPAAGFDNILIGKNGKAYMIDAGGAGEYKGTGVKMATKFGPQVGELKTMLDPRINPTTAPIFKGITDQQVVDQAVRIFQVRNDLLAATPAPLKAKLAARLDWLDNYITDLVNTGKATMPALAPPDLQQMAAAKPKPPTWASEAEHIKGIDKAGINGFSILTDKDFVEDTNTLVWTEKNLHGDMETVAQLKLRADAMKELDDLLKPLMPANATAFQTTTTTAVTGLPSDKYYDKILSGVKTVNHHVNDAAYNQAKVANALSVKQELTNLLYSATGDEKKMAEAYLNKIYEIENSIAQKPTGHLTLIPDYQKYQPPPPPAPAAPLIPPPVTAQAQWRVTVDNLTWVEKDLKNGEATQMNAVAFRSSGNAILIDMGDVKARYIPKTTTNDNYLWALEGQVEIRTAGDVTPVVMDRVEQAFRQLGIDVTPPSDDYRKALYLSKNMLFLSEGNRVPLEIEQIMKDKAMSDADRLQKIEEIALRDYKIQIKTGDTRWMGEVAPDGSGYRHYLRADMTEDQLANKMDGYVLTHALSRRMSMLDVMESFLNGGGQITPTAERLRKGVSIQKTGGMSPEPDLGTGGGSYFFTRIKKIDQITGGHLILDIRELARTDIYSYPADSFGDVKETYRVDRRRSGVSDYKKFARNGDNESNFKNGFNIEDVKQVVASTSNERDQLIQLFKSFGYDTLGGRPIEDVIIVSGQRFNF